MKKQRFLKDFDYFIGEFMYYCQSKDLRPKTLNSYEQALRLLEKWLKEEKGITEPKQVVEATIREYICDLQERGKYSVCVDEESTLKNRPDRRRDFRNPVSITTINNYIRNIRVFFNYLYDREEIERNPMQKVRQLKNERKSREYLEDDEVKKLFNVLDKSYYNEMRDYTIIILILDTGMRIGECLQLKIDYIDFNNRAISIPAEITKGRATRYVYFSLKVAKALKNWLRFKDRYVETDYLFPAKYNGLPIQVPNFEKNFRSYVNRSNIGKNVTPHCLRNNFAKRCLLAGMDIYTLSRILGHSSVSVTEKAYADLTDSDIRKRYQFYSPMENLK